MPPNSAQTAPTPVQRWRRRDLLLVGYTILCIVAFALIYVGATGRPRVLTDWTSDDGYTRALVVDPRGIWYTRTGGDLLAARSTPVFPFVIVPIAPLLAFPVLIVRGSIAAARTLRARDRRQLGLCVVCGYDLRVTTGRCPECGVESDKVNIYRGGLTLGGAIELLVLSGIGLLLLSIFLPTTPTGDRRRNCISQMGGCATALRMRGTYPPSLDAGTISTVFGPFDDLQCPLTGGVEHVYRGGSLPPNPPPTGVVLHDPAVSLHHPGTAFAFVDGHVEVLVDDEAHNFIRQLDQGINPPTRVRPR